SRDNPDLKLGITALQNGEWVRARKAFETASGAGRIFACVILGELYLQGLSVPYDLDQAVAYFEEAENENYQSTWAARRLAQIKQGQTYVQVIAENRQMRDNMHRLNATFTGTFTPLPAATEIPTQAAIDATIKGSPWTYAQLEDALKQQVNYIALATAIRTDGADLYAGEKDRLLALPAMAGQYEADTDLVGALISEAKPGAGQWAREMAQAAIAARRAQLPAQEVWTDSLALRRRAAQGELAALYQLSQMRGEQKTLGDYPEIIQKQLAGVKQRAVAENFAPALWLATSDLEINTDKSKIDLAQAAVYHRASALAGEAEGAWKLAQLYHATAVYETKQEGVADNYLAAEHWYIEAGALARPGQKVGYKSPEDCLYLLYSFQRPVGSTAFEMRTEAEDLRWARELLRRGGQVAENTKIALAALQARNPGVNVEKLLVDLPPEAPAFSAQQLAELAKSSADGDAMAALKLGDAYATGRGVLQDDVVANRWFTRAAELGDATAMRRLVRQYTSGCGVKVDVVQQRAWLRRIAESGEVGAWAELGRRSEGVERLAAFEQGADAGDAEALFELSDTWQYGRGGVEKDEAKFLEYAQRAADAGSAKAMGQLGFFYSYTKKDDATALQWYRRAVEAGDKKQRMVLAALYIGAKDKPAAEKIYREMAEEGDAVAQAKLGVGLFNGGLEDEGMIWLRKVATGPATNEQQQAAQMVRKYDEEEKAAPGSIPWLERRSRRGDADASFELGRKLYALQRPGALGLLRTAAETGHAKATALFYAISLGDKDQDKAWLSKWLEARIAENNAQAILIEGQLLAKTNLPEALKRFERAVELGNVEAKFHLGMAKYQGQQVTQDRAGGINLISESAEGDFPLAQFTLGKGLLKGDVGLEADPKRGLAWLEKAAAQDWQMTVTMQALVLLGQVYESGQVPGIARSLTKALENFDRAAKLDPRNAQLQQHLNGLRQQHSLEMKMGGKI
ncbi:MAG: sel1 repeat family protein, partial [Opitutaceae bacterium]|nr:sel1 repeat family protein [Opitutaceae bacterium]